MRDGPPDFPPDIEVRTREHHHYGLLIRRDAHDDRRYVLVTGKGPIYRVHGWCWGADKQELGSTDTIKNTREPAWIIEQHDLEPLETIFDPEFRPLSAGEQRQAPGEVTAADINW